jgi:hypothetical protein
MLPMDQYTVCLLAVLEVVAAAPLGAPPPPPKKLLMSEGMIAPRMEPGLVRSEEQKAKPDRPTVRVWEGSVALTEAQVRGGTKPLHCHAWAELSMTRRVGHHFN